MSMQIDPHAVLAVISDQATRIAALEHENAALREALSSGPPPAE